MQSPGRPKVDELGVRGRLAGREDPRIRILVTDDQARDVLAGLLPDAQAGMISIFEGAARCGQLFAENPGWRSDVVTAMVCRYLHTLPAVSLPSELTLRPVRRLAEDEPDGVALQSAVAAAISAAPAIGDPPNAFADFLRSLPPTFRLLAAVDPEGRVRATSGYGVFGQYATVIFVNSPVIIPITTTGREGGLRRISLPMAALDPARLAPDPEVAELAQDFLEAQRSPRTMRSYRTDLAVFFKWLAERDLHPLKAARPDIDRFRNYLAELVGPDGKPSPSGRPRYAPTTVSRRLATVRSVYGYLTERRVLPAPPAANIKGPRLSRDPKGRGMTEEQLKALIAAGVAHSRDADALVCLLALNGLRVSEVCGARVEDVVSEPGGGHSLIVRGKGGRLGASPRSGLAAHPIAGHRAGDGLAPVGQDPQPARLVRADPQLVEHGVAADGVRARGLRRC